MIPLIDLALYNKIVDVVSKIDLDGKIPKFLWAPSSLAIKMFIVNNQSGTITINLPGISLFRSQISEPQIGSSYPMKVGASNLVKNTDKGTGISDRRYNVTCNYELGIFTEKLSHLNNLDRVFTFFLIDNPIDVELILPGDKKIKHTFYATSADPSYDISESDVSATVKQYQLTRSISVEGYWLVTEEYPLITGIDVGIYDELTNGSLISLEVVKLSPHKP